MTTLRTRLSKLEASRPAPAEEVFVILSWDDPRLAGAPEPPEGGKVIKLTWQDELPDDDDEAAGDD